ncbi:MAG: hypothetical protein GXY25_14835 [Pirellulaceae bacterium]|jgi:hypothetical protein|nr:BNR-4 repeat-containing protein [Thermoguttaceae bacterium]NLZ01800.1 hypothetical protein [Pirellulaceae bacterium]
MNLTRISQLLLAAVLVASSASAQEEAGRAPFLIGGTGGAYFLAEPGELVIVVEKRDRNRSGRTADLRAILVGPDRRVIQDVTIPDDQRARGSGLGPVQTARLSTRVERRGVYGLNITVSNDRYGDEIAWGFQTNSAHYLIETARGHRDARREEPIVLLDPDQPRDVCFLPRSGPFGIEITGLPEGVEEAAVYDGKGRQVARLAADSRGAASGSVPATPSRDAVPWRLHLPRGRATVQIDGVTRWDDGDLYPNLPLWTPHAESWFPLAENRWLLAPYSRTAYGQPGSQAEIAFEVDNNAERKRTIRLELEFPGKTWPASLAESEVAIAGKRSAKVRVRYTVPASEARVHLRATPAGQRQFSTYSTLTVRPGRAPAAEPFAIPLVLKPYQHENEQFGYLADFPRATQVYFDVENRPFLNTEGGIASWRGGQWVETSLRDAVTSGDEELARQPFRSASNKLAFDADGGVYLLARASRRAALLHSADGGKTFAAWPLPPRQGRSQSFDLEQFSGHNGGDYPPPIARFTQTAADPKLIWRRINDLELFVPEKQGGRIVIGEPILISRQSIGLSLHSGSPSTIVSRGSKVHVVWAEATDPAEKAPGVPTYVVTYDRRTKTLGKPALVGHGPPANDVHNTPSITMDSRGHLHVLAGTHGRPFPYARSLQPNDSGGGWTEPAPTAGQPRQTYLGLVCGRDDALHLVSRVWRSGEEPFPASSYATLAQQRRPPDGDWQPPQALIIPPLSEYSVFYHRLTIDRTGRLFLSYDYWSTYWFYRTDQRGDRRVMIMSADGGKTWKLVSTSDLVGRPRR